MKNVVITFLSSSNSENIFPSLIETNEVSADKFVFYDNYIPARDFTATTHRAYLQLGTEKSEKMMNAFLKAFLKNYEAVIYFDPEPEFISSEIIKEAFEVLERPNTEVIIYGDKNGCLKLLGLKSLKPEIFEKQSIKDIVSILRKSQIPYYQISNNRYVKSN